MRGPVELAGMGVQVTENTLELSVRQMDEWTVVRALGELNLVTADRMTRFVWDSAAVAGRPRVVIDVGGLWMCDSSGLNAFVRTWKLLDSAGGTLVLASPDSRLARTLSITGLDRRLRTSPDIIHALRAERQVQTGEQIKETRTRRTRRLRRLLHRTVRRIGAHHLRIGRSFLALSPNIRWSVPFLRPASKCRSLPQSQH